MNSYIFRLDGDRLKKCLIVIVAPDSGLAYAKLCERYPGPIKVLDELAVLGCVDIDLLRVPDNNPLRKDLAQEVHNPTKQGGVHIW